MDISFSCKHCGQELEVDASAAGTIVNCPACSKDIEIPAPDAPAVPVATAPSTPAAGNKPRFSVPQRDTPSETLISKPHKPLEVAAKDDERKLRVKTFRHSDYVELGGDHFDEEVSKFLQLVGEDHIIEIDAISCSAKDPNGVIYPDFGIVIVFRG